MNNARWKRSMSAGKRLTGGLFALVAGLLSFAPRQANAQALFSFDAADVINPFSILLSQLVLSIANAVSAIGLAVLRVLLIPILQYNDFINHPVVLRGWEVTRDLVNVGFVAVLLVLAFGTMFGISRMNWKQHLPRLLIAAVAVNFSRLIVGLFIDIGQVVMVAFVNALQSVGPGNFIQILQFTQTQQIASNPSLFTGDSGLEPYQLLGTAVFALMLSLIVTVVLLLITAVLAYRIVVLWILIIMAPLAFLAGASQGMFGATSGQYSQWWQRLGGAIMIGPVLTFFLWLAMAAAGSAGGQSELVSGFNTGSTDSVTAGSPIISAAFSMDNLTGFIIAIALLMAGLELSANIASQAHSSIGNLVRKGQGYANKAAALPYRAVAAATGYGASKARDAAVYDAKRAGTAFKQRFYDGGFVGRIRQKNLERGQRNYQEAQSQTGIRGALARARYGVQDYGTKLQKAEEAQTAARKAATERQSGFGKHLGYEQIKEALEKREKFKGADGEAKVAAMQAALISRDEDLDRWLQEDPSAAHSAFQAEISRREAAGDDKGADALRKKADKDLRLKYDSVADAADDIGKWDDEKIKKDFSGLKKNLMTRQAARESGVADKIIEEWDGLYDSQIKAGKSAGDAEQYAKQYSKYGKKLYDQASELKASESQDKAMADWYSVAKRDLSTAKKSSDDYKFKKSRTEATRRFFEAAQAGKTADAVRDGLRLEDIDITAKDSTGASLITAKQFEDIAKAGGVGSTLMDLRDAEKAGAGANRYKDKGVAARAELGAAQVRRLVDRAVRSTAGATGKDATNRALNKSVLDEKTLDNFNYNATAKSFATAGDQQAFEAAIKSNPELLLSSDVTKATADKAVREAIATTFDSGAVLDLVKQHGQVRGTADADRVAQTLKVIEKALKTESTMLRDPRRLTQNTERLKTIERTLDTFSKRVNQQIKGGIEEVVTKASR